MSYAKPVYKHFDHEEGYVYLDAKHNPVSPDEIVAALNGTPPEVEFREDAERYRWLRTRCRGTFDDSNPQEPQIVYTRRSEPRLFGWAGRLDAAVDASMKAELEPQSQRPRDA